MTSVLICGLIFFVPESPRFLMSVGREDEADAFLVRYHGGGDPNSPIVRLQIEEMKQSFALQKMERWWDYRTLVKDHSARWRMVQGKSGVSWGGVENWREGGNVGRMSADATVIMMGIFGQFSGNGLAYYITVIFKQIGVTTVPAQLGYNILYSCMCAVGALTGAMLTDIMPRRRVLVIGPAVMSALLAIFVGLNSMINKQVGADGTGHLDPPLARGALAVYILFGIVISFVYTPLQSVLPVEALSTQMRAKGLAIYTFTMGGMGLINMFAGAQGLANLGYKYIIIFVAFDAFESVAWYFLGVESCGRTLEELDEIYQQAYPPGASKRFH